MYAQAKEEWFKNLGLHFDIGEIIYYKKDASEDIPCEMCKGRKGVNVTIDGRGWYINCPICQGRGYDRSVHYFKVQKAEVKHIDLVIEKDEYGILSIKNKNRDNTAVTGIWVKDAETNSSQFLKPAEIFKTAEEVEKIIKEEQKKNG